MQKLTYLVVLL